MRAEGLDLQVQRGIQSADLSHPKVDESPADQVCLLYTSRAHETVLDLVCRLLLEKKKQNTNKKKKKHTHKQHKQHEASNTCASENT